MALDVVNISAGGSITGLTGRQRVRGIALQAAAADATVKVDDSTAGTGEIKFPISAKAGTSESIILPESIIFKTGVYVTITGVGAVAIAYIG